MLMKPPKNVINPTYAGARVPESGIFVQENDIAPMLSEGWTIEEQETDPPQVDDEEREESDG